VASQTAKLQRNSGSVAANYISFPKHS